MNLNRIGLRLGRKSCVLEVQDGGSTQLASSENFSMRILIKIWKGNIEFMMIFREKREINEVEIQWLNRGRGKGPLHKNIT